MKQRPRNDWLGAAIAVSIVLGAAAGVMIGLATDDVGPWLTVGAATGAAVGAVMALIWRE